MMQWTSILFLPYHRCPCICLFRLRDASAAVPRRSIAGFGDRLMCDARARVNDNDTSDSVQFRGRSFAIIAEFPGRRQPAEILSEPHNGPATRTASTPQPHWAGEAGPEGLAADGNR